MMWCATVCCTRGVKLACSQSSMNWGSSSGQSSYHARGQYGESAAVLPKGWGSCPVTEISSEATSRGLATFLGRSVAVGRLALSMPGGEIFLTFPLPFQLVRGVPPRTGSTAIGQCHCLGAWVVTDHHCPWPTWLEGGPQLCGHRPML